MEKKSDRRLGLDMASASGDFQSRIASGWIGYRCVRVLEWGTWILASSPSELWLLSWSRPSVGFMSTSLFMTLYIMQTLSDVLLHCQFSRWSWATRCDGGTTGVGLVDFVRINVMKRFYHLLRWEIAVEVCILADQCVSVKVWKSKCTEFDPWLKWIPM